MTHTRQTSSSNSPAERLITFALNELGAEVSDDGVTLSDSFGSLQLYRHRLGLSTEDGDLITTPSRLRKHVARTGEKVNRQGLLNGTLLTELGVTPFSIQFRRDRHSESATSASLHLTRPVKLHQVRYQEIYTISYDHPTFFLQGGRWTIRQGDTVRDYEITPAMSTSLYQLGTYATHALLTRQAIRKARRKEAEKRLETVQHQMLRLQQQAAAIEAELQSLQADHDP